MWLKEKGYDDNSDKKGASNSNALGDWRGGQIVCSDKSHA